MDGLDGNLPSGVTEGAHSTPGWSSESLPSPRVGVPEFSPQPRVRGPGESSLPRPVVLGFSPLPWLGFQYLPPSTVRGSRILTAPRGWNTRALLPPKVKVREGSPLTQVRVLGSSSHPGLGSHWLPSTQSWSYKGHPSKWMQLVPHPHAESKLHALPI